MREFLRGAIGEVVKTALFCLVFCLVLLAVFAIVVTAVLLPSGVITAFSWILQIVACFLGGALFLHSGRTLFKGLAAGACAVLVTMLVFGFIGGFHLSWLFFVKLLVGAVSCALGGILGVKLRRE